MDTDFSGRVAFVTGASSGLGRHFADLLAKRGARVAIASRRMDRLTAFANELGNAGAKVVPISLDITDAKQIPRALDEAEALLGPIDVLVNNAGMSVQGLAVEFSAETFDSVMNTNVRGPFLLATDVGRRMISRKSAGRIVNIASIGSFRVLPGLTAYCTSKAALAMMTQCLAREWARHDINVNALCPGYIETELNAQWFLSEKGTAQVKSFPRRRLARERDLDDAFLLLASAASRGITGSLLTVDDGQSL